MSNIESTMYTLGQLARSIWPTGDMPQGLQGKVLVSPATGLALMLKTPAAKARAKVAEEDYGHILAKLPADLADPPGGVTVEDQGPFWLGYYQYLKAIERSERLGVEHLSRAGTLLFGERWQSDLAHALNVGDRRVREWIAGERRIPPGVWADVAALLRQRSNEGMALLQELDRASAKG